METSTPGRGEADVTVQDDVGPLKVLELMLWEAKLLEPFKQGIPTSGLGITLQADCSDCR